MSFLRSMNSLSLSNLPELSSSNANFPQQQSLTNRLQAQSKLLRKDSLQPIKVQSDAKNILIKKKTLEQFPQVKGLKYEQQAKAPSQQNLNPNSSVKALRTPKLLKSTTLAENYFTNMTSSINISTASKKSILKKQTTLNFEDCTSANIFSSFSDLCDKQEESSNCRSSDETHSHETFDSGDKTPQSKLSEVKTSKGHSIARLKSFKDINEAHTRHIDQKEQIIAKYKNITLNLDSELKKKNEQIGSQGQLIENLQKTIEDLNQQLEEANNTIMKTQKQNETIRKEINEQRKEAPEFQTLLDENTFLKLDYSKLFKNKKEQEDSFNSYKQTLSFINNWNTVDIIQEPTPEKMNELILLKVSDYNKRKEEQQQLYEDFLMIKTKYLRLQDDFSRLEQERRILKATNELQEFRIDTLREKDGYTKVFSRINGISMKDIEEEMVNLQKFFIDRQQMKSLEEAEENEIRRRLRTLENLRIMVESLKRNQENLEKHMKEIENKIQNQNTIISKYKYLEELDQIQRKADELLKCSRCHETLQNSITHVPCGHSFCQECHDQKKQKIESIEKISKEEKENRLCTCSICGSNEKGNKIYKDLKADQITQLYKHLIHSKDMLKLLISSF